MGKVAVNAAIPGTDSQLRLDIVITNEDRKKIIMVDVAVPFKNRTPAFHNAQARQTLENTSSPTNNATDSANATGDISMPIPEYEDISQEGDMPTVTDAAEDPVYDQETQQQQEDVELT
ncbi:hypothetical protein UY3_13156 [Chelonia mydas]|uniref:Uncharacterized protein n=1 Tax=Chelonia mydas TaxID=8469 RepID=M7BC27_CHEMY|nr:hypothetical protein UY3_13156 [Chelonia mydas]